MFAAAMRIDLHLPASHSLKEKRAVLKAIIDGIRSRHRVSAAEVDGQDLWQRAAVGVAGVSGTERVLVGLLDDVERFVWSFPDVDVLGVSRHWIEVE